jgi:hypothetical protein
MNKAIKMKKKPKKRPGRATGGVLVGLVRFFADLVKTLSEAWHVQKGSTGGGGGGGGGGGSTPAGRPAPAHPGMSGSSGPRVDGTRVGPYGAPGQAVHGQGQGRGWPGSNRSTPDRFEDPDLFEDDDLDDEDASLGDDGPGDEASEMSDDAGQGGDFGTNAGDSAGGEMGGDGSGGAA